MVNILYPQKIMRMMIVDSRRNTYVPEPDIESRVLNGICRVELQLVNREEDLKDLEDADAIISWHTVPLSAPTLRRLHSCKGIVRAAVGFDNIDIDTATALHVPVCNIPDYGTEEVADHTIALALALARGITAGCRHVENGGWDWRAVGELRRSRGSIFGIVGLGRIGTAVALRARQLGFNVQFFDPFVSPGIEKSLALRRMDCLEDLLKSADIVTLHVPLNAETNRLIGKAELNLMKPDALLVNTSRGKVVDSAALVERLNTTPEFRCGLDVVDTEPVIPVELLSTPRVLVTPHSAFYSRESLLELREKAALFAGRFLLGQHVPTVVNQVIYGLKV